MPWTFNATYPGITSFRSLDYAAGLGISPGVVNIACHPSSTPSARGDLTFGVTNGITTRTLTLVDCLLDDLRGTADANDRVFRIRMYDRRWKWVDRYPTDGHYNQTDNHLKLRPKTVRSLWQLVALLFKRMGENYPASASATIDAGEVDTVTVHDGGKGYTTPPSVTFVSGTPATATATIDGDEVDTVAVTNSGEGYTSAPTVSFTGGGGSGATATAVVSGGRVIAVTVTAPGTGYTSAPTVVFTGGFPVAATGTAVLTGDAVTSITIDSPGSGYTLAPRVRIDPPAGYFVDVQGGLAAPAGPNVPAPGPNDEIIDPKSDFLKVGENFTRSRSNPIVLWTATPAAVALAQLVEQFGRAVVFDPLTNLVTIQPLGSGPGLPAGRLLASSPALDLEAVPESVVVMGGPTRYQIRVLAVPVVRDWDGSWRRHDQCTMAPILPAGQKMKTVSRIVNYGTGDDYTVVVNGVAFTVATGAHASAADVYAAIVLAVNASVDPRINGVVTASMPTTAITLEADVNGYEFTLAFEPLDKWKSTCPVGPIPDPTDQINEWQVVFTPPTAPWGIGDTVTVTIDGTPYTSYPVATFDEAVASVANQINGAGMGYGAGNAGGGQLIVSGLTVGVAIAVSATISSGAVVVTETQDETAVARGFQRSMPGSFDNVMATDRLSFQEAHSLAKATAHTCFQIVAVNPADPTDYSIPMAGGLDPITDVTLLQLLDSRVEQTAPRPGDTAVIDPKTGQPFAAERYDGYSSDRPVAALGSINVACFGGLQYQEFGGVGANTPASQQIQGVGISVVDPLKGVVQFDRPIYRIYGEGDKAVFLPVFPVLEIGVLVCDPATFCPRRYSVTVTIPGATAPSVTRVFDDVRQEVIGEYDPYHRLLRSRVNDSDPEFRATTYANEVARNYQQPASETLTYSNMEEVHLSGVVRMVMWAFSAEGFSTIGSANSEFARILLAYGDRRRRENEPPDARRALENFMSQLAVRNLPKNVAESVGSIVRGVSRIW